MKTLLTLFVLFFSSSVFADDISDFQIEGMSIGDSLLEYFSEEEILSSHEYFYKGDKFRHFELFSSNSSIVNSILSILFLNVLIKSNILSVNINERKGIYSESLSHGCTEDLQPSIKIKFCLKIKVCAHIF